MRFFRSLSLAVAGVFLLAVAAGPILAEETSGEASPSITGTVEIVGKQGESEPAEGVMVLLTGVPAKSAPRLQEPIVMDQVNQTFSPHVLPVLAGQKVLFKNSEMTSHNVRLVRQADRKQLTNKFTAPNQQVPYTFEDTGVVDVLCDMHPSMHAYVLVLDEPFLKGQTGQDGRFSISVADVPAGDYALKAWSEDRGFTPSRTVSVPEAGSPSPVNLTFSERSESKSEG